MRNYQPIPSNRGATLTRFRFQVLLLILTAWAVLGPALSGPGRTWAQSGGFITSDGMYTIHTFTVSETFVPPAGVTSVEVLVVAGGGGGGGANAANAAGGGGAGGLVYVLAYPVAGQVTVTVGAGGAGGTGNARGGAGGNSVFEGLSAIGGGGGGGSPGANINGGSGGSGGGGANNNGNLGAGTPGQGYNGGQGESGPSLTGGGGGGAGAPGGNAAGNIAGEGGAGRDIFQFLQAGVGGWFAGGGGGGANVGTAGIGGIGGGGDGGASGAPGGNAVGNTGGGGGGSGGNGAPGGAGGSGIVIVRYMAPANTISVVNTVALNIGEEIVLAGEGQEEDTDDTAHLSWTSTVPEGGLNRITVRIDDGTVPAGLKLNVEITVDNIFYQVPGLDVTAQVFIPNIGNQTWTDQVLVYTLEVVDFGLLFAVEMPLTVTYTLEPQP